MLQLNTDELQRISNAVKEIQILLMVDESTLSGIQYLNIQVSYLYDCQPLPYAPNSNSIAQAVDDAVRFLRIKRNLFDFFIV